MDDGTERGLVPLNGLEHNGSPTICHTHLQPGAGTVVEVGVRKGGSLGQDNEHQI